MSQVERLYPLPPGREKNRLEEIEFNEEFDTISCSHCNTTKFTNKNSYSKINEYGVALCTRCLNRARQLNTLDFDPTTTPMDAYNPQEIRQESENKFIITYQNRTFIRSSLYYSLNLIRYLHKNGLKNFTNKKSCDSLNLASKEHIDSVQYAQREARIRQLNKIINSISIRNPLHIDKLEKLCKG